MRNVSEQEDRRFYYFYNENFAETSANEGEMRGLGLDAKLTHKIFKLFTWYYRHFKGLTSTNKVFLLTSNAQSKSAYERLLMQAADVPADAIYDVNDFVTRH